MFALFAGPQRPGGRSTFQLGPIPVRVEFSFWLTAALLGYLMTGGMGAATLVVVGVVFVSVLIHELGHALAYLSRGARAEVLLYGAGGLTMGRRDAPFRPGERLFTALAGPLAGMVFGAGVYFAQKAHGPFANPLAGVAIEATLFTTIGWGIFNLLPVLPMDGGHVLESLLCLKDELRGRIWARYVSIGFAAVLAPLALYLGWQFAAVLLVLDALQCWQTLALLNPKRQAELSRMPANAPPPEAPDVIENLARLHKLLAEEQPEQARAVAHQVLSAARGHGARDQALRALAWLSIGAGNAQEALGFLSKTSPRFDDPLTWGTAIAASGDALNALPHLARAFQRSADPQTVATYARCLASVGQLEQARKLAGPGSPVEVQRALGEALFRSRDFAGSAEISRRLYERAPHPLDAYNAACAESRLGHTDEALRWLQLALENGFDDRAHLMEDPDLEPLRAHTGWAELVNRFPGAPAAG
ncbi:MAG: hypothetical protein JST54_08605 [Deltaproteobacteria bacterium]|nr:hypothetical protein [Deltaproteobacteria bacterium]